MKTTSLNILNLCVPCYNHCRYCLLSWDEKITLDDYEGLSDSVKGCFNRMRNKTPNEWLNSQEMPPDTHLYSKKDLYLLYRKRFVEEENIDVLDITDERFSGSLRY